MPVAPERMAMPPQVPPPRHVLLWTILTLAAAGASALLLANLAAEGFWDGYRSEFERFWVPLRLLNAGLALLLMLWGSIQLMAPESSRLRSPRSFGLWLVAALLGVLLLALPRLMQIFLALDAGAGG